MTLTERDFTRNSNYARTVDVVQPIVKAMRTAGQDDSQIEHAVMQYMETQQLPDSAMMDVADAALIRQMIDQNAQAIERADFISNFPTEWEARGTDKSGE